MMLMLNEHQQQDYVMAISSENAKHRVAQPYPGLSDPVWHGIPTAAARRFHQICVARSSEVYGQLGLTPLQFGAMVRLNRVTGTPGLEQNVLASRMNIDRNTASVLVQQMVKLGVLEQRVNGADRRARQLSLTAKGEKFYARLFPEYVAVNETILTPLEPREQKQFMALLVRVIEGNLRQMDGAPRRRRRNKRQVAVNKA
jgi:DNA-binding MarR family transcriptional regulator